MAHEGKDSNEPIRCYWLTPIVFGIGGEDDILCNIKDYAVEAAISVPRNHMYLDFLQTDGI